MSEEKKENYRPPGWKPVQKGEGFPVAKVPYCEHGIACRIHASPFRLDINNMLAEGKTGKQIDDYLIERGQPAINPIYMAKHKHKCLKLEPSAKVKRTLDTKASKAARVDLAKFDIPTAQEIKDESLKLYMHRLRTDPKSISNQLLGTVLGHALKSQAAMEELQAKQNPKSAARDLVKKAFSQLEDGQDVEPEPEDE